MGLIPKIFRARRVDSGPCRWIKYPILAKHRGPFRRRPDSRLGPPFRRPSAYSVRHHALILHVNFILFVSCPHFNPHLASAITTVAPSSWPSRYAPRLSSSGRARYASKGSLDAGHGAGNTSYSSLRSILSRQRPLKPVYIAPAGGHCRALVLPAFYLNCGAIPVWVALFVRFGSAGNECRASRTFRSNDLFVPFYEFNFEQG